MARTRTRVDAKTPERAQVTPDVEGTSENAADENAADENADNWPDLDPSRVADEAALEDEAEADEAPTKVEVPQPQEPAKPAPSPAPVPRYRTLAELKFARGNVPPGEVIELGPDDARNLLRAGAVEITFDEK